MDLSHDIAAKMETRGVEIPSDMGGRSTQHDSAHNESKAGKRSRLKPGRGVEAGNSRQWTLLRMLACMVLSQRMLLRPSVIFAMPQCYALRKYIGPILPWYKILKGLSNESRAYSDKATSGAVHSTRRHDLTYRLHPQYFERFFFSTG